MKNVEEKISELGSAVAPAQPRAKEILSNFSEQVVTQFEEDRLLSNRKEKPALHNFFLLFMKDKPFIALAVTVLLVLLGIFAFANKDSSPFKPSDQIVATTGQPTTVATEVDQITADIDQTLAEIDQIQSDIDELEASLNTNEVDSLITSLNNFN